MTLQDCSQTPDPLLAQSRRRITLTIQYHGNTARVPFRVYIGVSPVGWGEERWDRGSRFDQQELAVIIGYASS